MIYQIISYCSICTLPMNRTSLLLPLRLPLPHLLLPKGRTLRLWMLFLIALWWLGRTIFTWLPYLRYLALPYLNPSSLYPGSPTLALPVFLYLSSSSYKIRTTRTWLLMCSLSLHTLSESYLDYLYLYMYIWMSSNACASYHVPTSSLLARSHCNHTRYLQSPSLFIQLVAGMARYTLVTCGTFSLSRWYFSVSPCLVHLWSLSYPSSAAQMGCAQSKWSIMSQANAIQALCKWPRATEDIVAYHFVFIAHAHDWEGSSRKRVRMRGRVHTKKHYWTGKEERTTEHAFIFWITSYNWIQLYLCSGGATLEMSFMIGRRNSHSHLEPKTQRSWWYVVPWCRCSSQSSADFGNH